MKTDNHFGAHTLPNGLRIVVEQMPDTRSVAAGFLARTGARDEVPELAGISHFLEHMCFKGTTNRTWEQINTEFDDIAVDYNAFTSEERTFYYGWVQTENLEKQIELLADMMRSRLPAEEFDMEKKVVLDEIARSNDQLMHVAYDFLHNTAFDGHPLGWPVLGHDATVEALTREQMSAYYQERYAPNNLILIAAGDVTLERVIELAEKFCGQWESGPAKPERQTPKMKVGSVLKQLDQFGQQIVALCYPAPSSVDPLHETANAAASILGGQNSRFFWNIVQEGISPDASCYRIPYCDYGMTLLWGQADPQNCERLLEAMQSQAEKIGTSKVDEQEVQRVKNKRRTSLAVESEAPYYRLVQIMGDVDLLGAPRSIDQRLADVDAITVDRIAEYFESYPFDAQDRLLISVGPRDWQGQN